MENFLKISLLSLLFSSSLFAADSNTVKGQQVEKYSIGTIRNKTLNADLQFCVNNGGTEKCNLKVKGATGDVGASNVTNLTNDGPPNFPYGASNLPVKNFITKGSAENNSTSGWVSYADAAGLKPVDGTGGTSSLTLTANNTTPLDGTYDFKLAKGAVNEQGEGVSYDFTISKATTDNPRPLTIEFDYRVTTNFDYGNGFDSTFSDPSDIVVYIYNRDNSVLIQPSGFTLNGSGHFSAMFQPAAGADDYRLILHVAGVTATAWDFYFDNVTVSPQASPRGPPATDSREYTASITNSPGFSLAKTWWKQIGETVEIRGSFIASGTGGGSSLLISIPSGFSVDTSKMNSTPTSSDGGQNGSGMLYDGSTFDDLKCNIDANRIWFQRTSVGGLSSVFGSHFTSGDTLNFLCYFPISGWSSSTALSSENDGRRVSGSFYKNSSQTFTTGSVAKVTWSSITEDTHAAFDDTNDRYYVKVSGEYQINTQLTWASGSSGIRRVYIRKNGSAISESGIGNNGNEVASIVSKKAKLNAGDYIEIWAFQNNGGDLSINSGDGSSWFDIFRISGNETLAAPTVVAARVERVTSSQSIPNGSTTVAQFNSVLYDSHNAWNSGNYRWYAPISGYYSIVVGGTMSANGTGYRQFDIRKNGSVVGRRAELGSSLIGGQTHVTTQINLNAGDYIDYTIYQNSGFSLDFEYGGPTYMAISRIGGVM